MNDDGSGESGFTLIEILLSFAILVAAVAILQSGFGGGWKSVRAADAEMEALEIARAKLAAAGVETPLEPGISEGDAGRGFTWRMFIEPQPAPTASETTLRGYWTTVEVNWNDRRTKDSQKISLKTLKLGRVPAGVP